MGDIKQVSPPIIWPNEMPDDVIVSYLITIERKRIGRQKKWKIEPLSEDWWGLRAGWLTQKYRILLQNGRV